MAEKRDRGVIGAFILILIGAVALLNQMLPGGLSLLSSAWLWLGAGALFIVAGLFTRESGWFVPGGILVGLGAGFAFTTGPLASSVSAQAGGGLFLVALGAGFGLVTLLTALFAERTHWWALVPGGILAAAGLAGMYGGVFSDLVRSLDWIWPLALILLGVVVLLRRGEGREPRRTRRQRRMAGDN